METTGIRYPKLYELGLATIVAVLPLVFLPASTSPFADIKLVTLVLGVLLLWASRPPLDRQLGILGGIWFAAGAAAAIFGVDPLRSLTGPENAPGGLLLIGTSAYLLAVGAAMPREFVARIPRWLVVASMIVAGLVIGWRVAPSIYQAIFPDLSMVGSTLGNGPFLASYVALGLIALPHVPLPTWALVLCAAVFGVALGGTPHRAALLVTVIGFVITLWHAKVPRAKATLIATVAVVAFLAWGLVLSSQVPAAQVNSGQPALVASFTNRQANSVRLASIAANVRSGLDRPAFGWGPGNGLSAWTAGVLPSDFPAIEQFADAHNILAEQFATTGFVGMIAFLALVGSAGLRALRRPRPLGWVAGGTVMLALAHLIEPMNVVITSLAFLVLGLAARPKDLLVGDLDETAVGEAVPQPKKARFEPARWAVGVLLVGALCLSLLTLGSAVMEQHERQYFEPEHRQLRLATRLTPWRMTSIGDLAEQLALDARGGDEAAKVEAFVLADRLMDEHPWSPDAYRKAIRIHVLALDPEGALPLIEKYVDRFPNVPRPVLQDMPGGEEVTDEGTDEAPPPAPVFPAP